MKKRDWGVDQLGKEGLDTILGIALLGVIIVAILLTSASAFAGEAVTVTSAQGMAEQLRPLAGPGAFYLFTVGFFFATLSTLVVNPLVGATLFVDGFGRDAAMDHRPVKLWATFAMAVGLGVVLAFEGSPIELIRTAQAVAILGFPLLGFLLFSLSRDGDVMGEHRHGIVVDVLGVLGYVAIVGIVLNHLTSVVGYF